MYKRASCPATANCCSLARVGRLPLRGSVVTKQHKGHTGAREARALRHCMAHRFRCRSEHTLVSCHLWCGTACGTCSDAVARSLSSLLSHVARHSLSSLSSHSCRRALALPHTISHSHRLGLSIASAPTVSPRLSPHTSSELEAHLGHRACQVDLQGVRALVVLSVGFHMAPVHHDHLLAATSFDTCCPRERVPKSAKFPRITEPPHRAQPGRGCVRQRAPAAPAPLRTVSHSVK